MSARRIVNTAEEVVEQQPQSAPLPRVTRATRKPFGSTDQKLAYPQREGYHRHWFNDEPGRIFNAEQAGYVHVHGHDGKPVTRVVGTKQGGGPLMGFLMEIPQDWWEEDMGRLQSIVDEKEKGIKRGYIEKSDPKDAGAFYAGSDKGKIEFKDTFSRPRA